MQSGRGPNRPPRQAPPKQGMPPRGKPVARPKAGTRPAARRQGGAATGIHIHPRFFVFLLLLVVVIFLIWRGLSPSPVRTGMATVRGDSLGSQFQAEAVIVRNETLSDAESVTAIDFLVNEGERVSKGTALCRVYSAGYNQTEINRLQTFRDRIAQYHRERLIHNYIDPQLDQLDTLIGSLAQEVRTLVQGQGVGSLANLEMQLGSALSARQTYLHTKYPDDTSLAALYDDETRQLRKIESWTTSYAAQQDSLVSFYTDGYELTVNKNTYETMTPAQVRTVLSGQQLAVDTLSRGRQPLFRTVVPDTWYVLLLSREKNWNPVVGQQYKMQLEGFESYLVDAVVQSFTLTGGELLVRMEVKSDVRPVLNIRTCRVVVGEFVDGLLVPLEAIITQDGQRGVVITDLSGEMFIPVIIRSYDQKNAFVQPLYMGSLLSGQTVKTFPGQGGFAQ